jgi:hypothetical protein
MCHRKFVIPTGATPLFLARGFCVQGRAVEGPWLDLTLAHLDEINTDLSKAPTKNKNPADMKTPTGSIFLTS